MPNRNYTRILDLAGNEVSYLNKAAKLMSDWNEQIPRCFGRESLIFAGTPSELAAAKRLRADIRRESIPPALLVSAIEDWLHTETSNTGQLYEQMAHVRSFFAHEAAHR